MQSLAYEMAPASSATTDCSGDRRERDLLAQVVRERDRQAFEELYHRYRRRLGPFMYRFTQDAAANEEVLNDVMMVVWRNGERFNGRSRLSTWIFGIAYRQCLKHLRGRVETEDLPEIVDDADLRTDFESKDLVRRALAGLSAEHRMVIELWYFAGFNYREIGEIADCPENTVKTRVFHARRHLRKIMDRLGENGHGDGGSRE